ncbi:DUF3574 domain-containing protein [Maridesulfovibrio frigidus]|uniref:DUF3574 domain-containing protein n=1 Tax=Maridesulfovibrio frigidus TaxID=340956 RepID=UPI00068BB223|nr:DUF3574 domain-containing protein [Maridesulfovibrio frigidus]
MAANKFRLLILVLLLFVISGCGAGNWNRYELYFGLSAEGGKTEISEQQWANFMQTEIAPAFSDGFTIYNSSGFWNEDGRTYAEKSKVLMVVSPDSETDLKINNIAQSYKAMFEQDSVLKLVNPVQVEFR